MNMIFKSFISQSLYTTFHTGIYSTVRYTSSSKVVESTIKNKLQTALNTYHLEVVNETGNNEGAQLKLVIVTDKFHGLPMYKRYNLINDILKEELQAGAYKLSIVAQTPIQWHRVQSYKQHPISSDSGGVSDK